MRYKELTETPISDFDTIGDFSKSSSYRHEQDRKLLTNPKSVQKIITKWEKTPVNFNLQFVNNSEARKYLEVGEVTIAWLEENMPKTLPLLDIKSDAINIIFTNNTGAERVPMTAWVIAHRFGHALAKHMGIDGARRSQTTGYIAKEFYEIRDLLIRNCSELLSTYGFNVAKSEKELRNKRMIYDNRNDEATLLDFYKAIGTMKSARERNIRTEFEFILELLAQYMLTGSVKFNPLPRSFNHGKPLWGRFQQAHFRQTDYDYTYNNENLQEFAQVLNDYFENLLRICVGHIFVM